MKTAPPRRDARGRFSANGHNGHASRFQLGDTIPQEPRAPADRSMKASDLVRGIFMSAAGIIAESDKALRENRALQREMKRDPDVLGPLLERQYGVALMEWDIVPEKDDDMEQARRARIVKDLIANRLRRLTALIAHLDDGIWFGRGAAHIKYDRVKYEGRDHVAPIDWHPYHPDSIYYTDDGVPGVLVSTRYKGEKVAAWRGFVHLFDATERRSTVIHVPTPEASDYDEYREAGYFYGGRGLRDHLWWWWMMKQTVLQNWMTAVERYAMGIRKVYHEASNDAARDAMLKAVDNLGRDMTIAIPRMVDEHGNQVNDVEIDDIAGKGGFQIIVQLADMLSQKIKEVIIGQTATSEATATGLGSDVGTRHAETKLDKLKRDAKALGDTLTHDLVREVYVMNFGESDCYPRWEFAVEHVDAEQYLAAVAQAAGLGIKIAQRSVRQTLGYEEPRGNEPVVQTAEDRQAQQMAEQGGGGGFDDGFESGFEFARSDDYGRAIIGREDFAGRFEEHKHPRGREGTKEGGRFVPKGGGAGTPVDQDTAPDAAPADAGATAPGAVRKSPKHWGGGRQHQTDFYLRAWRDGRSVPGMNHETWDPREYRDSLKAKHGLKVEFHEGEVIPLEFDLSVHAMLSDLPEAMLEALRFYNVSINIQPSKKAREFVSGGSKYLEGGHANYGTNEINIFNHPWFKRAGFLDIIAHEVGHMALAAAAYRAAALRDRRSTGKIDPADHQELDTLETAFAELDRQTFNGPAATPYAQSYVNEATEWATGGMARIDEIQGQKRNPELYKGVIFNSGVGGAMPVSSAANENFAELTMFKFARKKVAAHRAGPLPKRLAHLDKPYHTLMQWFEQSRDLPARTGVLTYSKASYL